MIELHRLGKDDEPFQLNPDLVMTVEAVPDTTIVLTTGNRVVVVESVEQVIGEIAAWRVRILADSLERANASRVVPLR
jgi:flagellar protein FlbD